MLLKSGNDSAIFSEKEVKKCTKCCLFATVSLIKAFNLQMKSFFRHYFLQLSWLYICSACTYINLVFSLFTLYSICLPFFLHIVPPLSIFPTDCNSFYLPSPRLFLLLLLYNSFHLPPLTIFPFYKYVSLFLQSLFLFSYLTLSIYPLALSLSSHITL